MDPILLEDNSTIYLIIKPDDLQYSEDETNSTKFSASLEPFEGSSLEETTVGVSDTPKRLDLNDLPVFSNELPDLNLNEEDFSSTVLEGEIQSKSSDKDRPLELPNQDKQAQNMTQAVSEPAPSLTQPTEKSEPNTDPTPILDTRIFPSNPRTLQNKRTLQSLKKLESGKLPQKLPKLLQEEGEVGPVLVGKKSVEEAKPQKEEGPNEHVKLEREVDLGLNQNQNISQSNQKNSNNSNSCGPEIRILLPNSQGNSNNPSMIQNDQNNFIYQAASDPCNHPNPYIPTNCQINGAHQPPPGPPYPHPQNGHYLPGPIYSTNPHPQVQVNFQNFQQNIIQNSVHVQNINLGEGQGQVQTVHFGQPNSMSWAGIPAAGYGIGGPNVGGHQVFNGNTLVMNGDQPVVCGQNGNTNVTWVKDWVNEVFPTPNQAGPSNQMFPTVNIKSEHPCQQQTPFFSQKLANLSKQNNLQNQKSQAPNHRSQAVPQININTLPTLDQSPGKSSRKSSTPLPNFYDSGFDDSNNQTLMNLKADKDILLIKQELDIDGQIISENMRRKGRAVNKVKEYDNLPVEVLNDVSGIKDLGRCFIRHTENLSVIIVYNPTSNNKPPPIKLKLDNVITIKEEYSSTNPTPQPSKNNMFMCDIENCNTIFSRFEDLVRHRKMHSADRPYHCQVPGCDFRCKRKDNLKSHQRTHEAKRYFCEYEFCKRRDRGFTRKDELKRHYYSHVRKVSKRLESCQNEAELDVKVLEH